MPRLGLTQMKPGRREAVAVRLWQVVLPVVCAAWVAGCAGSSNSATPTAGWTRGTTGRASAAAQIS